MRRVVFDTSVYIKRKVTLSVTDLPRDGLLSAIVIQELLVGLPNLATVGALQKIARTFDSRGRLHLPSAEDWLAAGRVMHLLRIGAKSSCLGISDRVGNVERLVNDVLIARTVGAANAILVTANLKDARLIARYQAFDFLSDDEYFEAMT